VRGQIKVSSLTDFAEERFAVGSELYIEKLKKYAVITESQMHKGLHLLKFDGIDDRDLAQALLHTYLQISLADIGELPEGEYYYFQLKGLQVFEDDILLGKIVDIRPTGANDVYYVKTPEGKEILLPALKDVVLSVDLKEQKMQVKVPAGLLDI
ncbi:MAG: 16S rRNA processing protein RimM, partial [Peptococcaceae bacterium]|nr:16S rRNA processing protein RimM [Peptococcaceae bacterium]